ncbi:MAG: hypothetical protein NZ926_00275 [Candidatus Methanomethylicia archaeon]|nr:hypothetical protein [Candidatus Methanomethylicia archaeon]MCX8168871.1 hypothetical protein [Candidatus Methanomethylicia archaeon]MDW7988603.1 hypothetical protein [Nitrososphaerota archaeon]
MDKGTSYIEVSLSILILISSILFTFTLISRHNIEYYSESSEDIKFLSLLISLDEIGFLNDVYRSNNYMKLYNLLKQYCNGIVKLIVVDSLNDEVIFNYPQNILIPLRLYYPFYSFDGKIIIIFLGWKIEG